MMPQNLIIPTPVEIRPLSQLAHGLKSGPITIVDAQTFLITDFHYDGLGPAGYWWATPGARSSSSGIQLKDENGSAKPLRRYNGETVVISLPQGSTIYDFDWLGVWCSEFQVDFGSTRIPQNIRVPPSPRMLGIEPEVSSDDNKSGKIQITSRPRFVALNPAEDEVSSLFGRRIVTTVKPDQPAI